MRLVIVQEERSQFFKVDRVNWYAETIGQFFKTHPVKHDRLITFQHLFGYYYKLTLNAFASGQQITTSQKPGDRNIAAEVPILNWLDDEFTTKSAVQLPNHLLKDRGKESSSEDRARRVSQLDHTFPAKSLNESLKL